MIHMAPTHLPLPSSPRNHWLRLSAAMEALAGGRAAEAWRIVAALRHSELLGPETVEPARALIAAALEQGPGLPLDLPTDYLRHSPGKRFRPRFSTLPAKRNLMRNYPFELALPPLTGVNNDFAFIADAARQHGFTGAQPDLRLRLVVMVQDAAEADQMARLLAAQPRTGWTAPAPDMVIFAPALLHGRPLPLAARWHDGAPWVLDRAAQMAQIADGADVLLFLPVAALADRLLQERALRYAALSDRLCMPLTALPEAQPDRSETVLTEQALQESWQRMPFAFRRIDALAFAVSAARFRQLGGFEPRFASPEFAAREFAFRAYNSGCYFLPLAVRARLPAPQPGPGHDEDKALYEHLSPNPWDRKHHGRFEVPKVSIYIPAYKAARYLGDAIDSVLSQDYEDLEICVADDGSPDSTRKVLESYGDEPRLRWVSVRNGGIGWASNTAIRLSRGIYIGQLDSDDRLKPGAVRRLADFLDSNNAVGCVYGSCERVDALGNYLQDEYSFPQFSREKMMLTSIAHHFRMFRRQVWERTEGFREDIVNAVDYDIFLKMSEVAQFHHVEEVLYQRRWHGENTSNVNEGFQTQNTHIVQRRTLERLGLDRYWDVCVPDPDKPREVSYRRTGSGDRVFFWPDYSRANPYQRLLYASASDRTEILGGDLDTALRAAREVKPGEPGQVVFHLHWLNKILESAKTAGEAADAAQKFLEKLRQFRFCGGRLVWTIHNIVSHDLPFPQIETQLARQILDLADAVHVHSAASLPEIEAHFPLPHHKLQIARHGAYVGAYPDFISPAQARAELGLDPQDEVILFLGQMRPYKGVEELVGAFRSLLAERPRARLVLAGAGQGAAILDSIGLTPEERGRILLVSRFIDDMELQVFFRAADFTVLPYRRILTSGSLLLSLSFGVPVVIPDFGMTREVLGDGAAGALYPLTDSPDALAGALRQMFARIDAGALPAMRAAARARAEATGWEDIGPLLLGRTG